jgi:modulator of FtsH protease HflC
MKKIIPIILGALVLALWSSAYIVKETEQVIVTQFGKPVGEAVTDPGIHFKLPVIQDAHFFDRRYLEWDGAPNQVPTKDKRFIWIDTYARWKITDPLRFFQRLRDERGAQSRLDDILDGEARNAVANHDLVEIIRTSNRDLPESSDDDHAAMRSDDDAEYSQDIQFGREAITKEILKAAQSRITDLGIEVLDFRFKRINYVEEVRRKVYDRMISERRRIADKYRSEGQGEASKINGEKDRELKAIQSDAYRRSQEIVGRADAEATAIYASAYDQSASSRDFYSFLKTMETYLTSIDEKTSLVMSTGSSFFKGLSQGE